jgi:hypothetical protein
MKKTLGIVILLLLTPAFLFCQDKEEVISLLYELDEQRTKFGYEITFIEEFNFGIPGGSNWLVQWYEEYNRSIGKPQRSLMIYVVDIDTKEIKFRDMITLRSDSVSHHLFSFYQNLQGVTIEDGICHISDLNKDGFDEILEIVASRLAIIGYDPRKGEIKWYCKIPYDDIDKGYSSPPVEFLTYKGMDGFKVRYFQYDVAGGPGWVPEPNPDNGKWFFYTWDKGRREFVEVEEFEEDWEKSYKEPVQPVLAEQNTGEFAQDRETQKETASSDSGKNPRFYFYIAIAVGVIALALAVFFVVRRKKG